MNKRVVPPHEAPLPPLALGPLLDAPLDPSTKGLPADCGPVTPAAIGDRGWSVLAGDLPLPQAVIRQRTLQANSLWMKRFTELNGLLIAPHGKTTMAPQLYDLQARDGAWAITVATTQQMGVALRFGVKRVLLANQPVGRKQIDAIFAALAADAGAEILCLADSVEGVEMLAEGAARFPKADANPLRVLVELGADGARTGARRPETAMAVARATVAAPGLRLAGFECFEGLLADAEAVDRLVDAVVAAALTADAEGLLEPGAPLIITAGGSAYFDRVGERFSEARFGRPVLKLLRSGCYLTHDVMGYARAFERILAQTSLKLPEGRLEPALEVWAYVQSRPEPERALLTMGKRDVGWDSGMPRPMYWFRPGGDMAAPQPVPPGHEVVALNDQHAHMRLPETSPLKMGDMVGFGIGHPCTTFDRWALLMLVDDDYRVTGAVRTFF